MTEPIELTPEQKEFFGKACAFLRTNPSPDERDKLFVLARMLLPEPVVKVLRERANPGNGASWDDAKVARWLQ